jgi:soluble lytic murein transglycosylase-like protein
MTETEGLKPLGPEGIERRISEIRARMAHIMGSGSGSFSNAIGFADTLKPFDIQANGISIQSQTPADLMPLIDQAAQSNNVDKDLFTALVAAESSFNPNARSSAGAMGLTQLMPGTAAALGVRNPFDPSENLHGGATYLRQLLDRFHDVPMALAAYNAGPGAVTRYSGVPPYAETQAYVKRIMADFNARKGL